MKWVYIGIGQALVFVAIAASIDERHRTAIVGGGVLATVLMYLQYAHAKTAGLAHRGQPTETYGGWS